MDCLKTKFETLKKAKKRANEINTKLTIDTTKTNKGQMRSYKCEECGGFHLSSMSEHKYKYKTDKKYKQKVNEIAFIKKESAYWNKKFKIDD
jgi:hypothetical protein